MGMDVLYTLEKPWLDNKSNISCIPEGVYKAVYLPRSGSGKYRKVWHLLNVEDRFGILIHNGNIVDHTQGCILVGTKHGTLGGKPAVLGSRGGMRTLLDIVGQNSFMVNVTGDKK